MRDLSLADSLATPTAHVAADEPFTAVADTTIAHEEELSDADLDEVVGGLARAWSDRAIARLIRG